MNIQNELFKMQDKNYKNFHSKLIPTIDSDLIIGVRTPVLRKFAKEFSKTSESKEFIGNLPHKYYEENNLHAFIIEQIKDFDEALEETEKFLPYIDNWATCDSFLPKIFKKNTDKLLPYVKKWITSDKTYTIRYGIGVLMSLYLDNEFKAEYLKLAASVKSDEYYVNMMIAWYFATALAKQYDYAVPFITEYKLAPWIHNKTIQKSVESLRITKDTKEFLKSYKIKI